MVETRLQERSLAVQVDKLRSSHHLLAAQMKSRADSINARFDRLEAMWLQATGKSPLDPGPSIPPTPLNHSSSRPPDPLSLDCDESVSLKQIPTVGKVVDGRNHQLLARNASVGREISRNFEDPLSNFVEHMVGQKHHEVSMVENPKMEQYSDGFGRQAPLSTSSVTSPLPKKPPDPPDLCHSGMISATKASPRIKEAPLSSVNSKTSTHKLQRKYSSEEVYERVKLGLCMFCDELDISDHHLQHKRSRIYMIEGDDNQVSYDKATDDVSVKGTVAYDKKGMKQAVCGSGYVNDCVDSKAVGNNHHVSESELASWKQSACKAVPDVVKMTTLRLGDSSVMIVNATGGVMDDILSFTDCKSSELSGQVTELLSMKSMVYAINVNDSGPRVWEPGGLPTEAAQCYWREKQYSQEDISLQTQKLQMKFEAALWEQHSSSCLTIRNAPEVIRLHEMNLFLCLQCSETPALVPREIRDGVKTSSGVVRIMKAFSLMEKEASQGNEGFSLGINGHKKSSAAAIAQKKYLKTWKFKYKLHLLLRVLLAERDLVSVVISGSYVRRYLLVCLYEYALRILGSSIQVTSSNNTTRQANNTGDNMKFRALGLYSISMKNNGCQSKAFTEAFVYWKEHPPDHDSWERSHGYWKRFAENLAFGREVDASCSLYFYSLDYNHTRLNKVTKAVKKRVADRHILVAEKNMGEISIGDGYGSYSEQSRDCGFSVLLTQWKENPPDQDIFSVDLVGSKAQRNDLVVVRHKMQKSYQPKLWVYLARVIMAVKDEMDRDIYLDTLWLQSSLMNGIILLDHLRYYSTTWIAGAATHHSSLRARML